MSDYATLEASIQGSRPVELYEFSSSPTSFLYTSSEDAITYLSGTYLPRSIARAAILLGVDSRQQALEVTIPSDDDLLSLFRAGSPVVGKVPARILRLQRDETPAPVARLIFSGFAQMVQYDLQARVAKIAVAPREMLFAKTIPRFSFQALCNNQLGDARCGADLSKVTFVGNCSAISYSGPIPLITVDGSGSTGLKFIGGTAQIDGTDAMRMVIGQGVDAGGGADSIRILADFEENPVGQNVRLVGGCDHLLNGDCGLTFDNVLRNAGYSWVPKRNIFNGGLQ